ncbi:MAG: hypothetical protein IMF26_03935 [Candidatus Fermentithermobacillus carboniphilus]|uniref:ABC transporter permease n=1 Tax=Candidatus Fermentithermobacillus carboniphilus TaxID=3085328 RepID=A0AAT9LDV3_9FIRM|nr:MAG: hypothetical protein IMF26_03935 [Candidatus Fermentithermobacillus carboniphilus]
MTLRNSPGFRTIVAYEAKRTWRSFLPFSIIAASIILYLLAPALSTGDYGELGFQSPSLSRHGDLVQVVPLLGVLLGAYSAWETQRDRRTQTEEIMLGWPVQAWQWSLARSITLASVTAAVFLSLAIPSAIHTAISYATAVGSNGSWVAYAVKDAGTISVDLMASLLGSQAIGEIAGYIFSGISAIVLVILYRLAVLVGPGIIMGTMQWPYPLLVSPDLIASNYWVPYSEAFGLVPHEELFLTHRLFWLAGSLCAIAALSVLGCYRRDARGKLPILAFGAIVLLAIGSAIPFIRHENRIVEAQQNALAAFGQPVKPKLVVGEDGHVDTGNASSFEDAGRALPLGYKIVADFSSPPNARISATVTLKSEASVSELDFTLRRVFKVDGVELNGHPIPADNLRREGDILVIVSDRAFTIGEVITVTITYSGKVEDWRLDPYERPVAIARRGMLVVPATWGWYPVPGRHELTWEIPLTSLVYRHLEDRARPFGDAEPLFDVTLIPPQGISAVAGFVPRNESVGSTGTNARGEAVWMLNGRRQQVSLLGGNWAAYRQEGIEYLVPVQCLDTWESCSKSFRELVKTATEWIGLDSAIVVPYSFADPQFIDAGLFGPIYYGGSDWTVLYRAMVRWIWNIHRFGLRRDQNAGNADAAYQYLFSSHVVDYVISQIARQSGVEEAVDPSEGYDDEAPLNELEQRFREWTRKTPVQEQKQVLRRLFAAARQRPLLAEDFQFLQRGVK